MIEPSLADQLYEAGYEDGWYDYATDTPMPAEALANMADDYQDGYLRGYQVAGRG